MAHDQSGVTTSGPTPRSEFLAGCRDTLPLVIAGIPFGIIFGALGVTSGLSPAATQAMSAFVFAGSAQFIATGLVAAGLSPTIIVLTTFVVNLRHALYSITLGPHLRQMPQRWLLPLGFLLTDESFVVAVNRYASTEESDNKHWYYLGSAVFMYADWQLSTFIGVLAGQSIPNPAGWGLDFAMIVTFVGMLVPLIKDRPLLVAVVVAGAVSIGANPLPGHLSLIAAPVAGVAAGLISEHLASRAVTDESMIRQDLQ